jgi:hypothetical protein
VERVADPQPPGPPAPGLEDPRHLEHGGLVAGDHHRGRPVDRRDAHLVFPAGQRRGHLFLARLHRHHRPAGGQGLHQPTPGRDQPAPVGQRPYPRHRGGGEFAHRVPDYEVGPQAPRLEQAAQRDLDGEQPGLGVQGLVEQRRAGGAGLGEQHVPQGAVQVGVQVGAELVQGLREHRVGSVQPPAHPGPLGALAGEQERHPSGGGGGHTFDHVRPALFPGESCQPVEQLPGIPRHDDRAILQVRPCRGQRVRNVGQLQLGTCPHELVQPIRLRSQAVGAAAADHAGHHPRPRHGCRRGR